MFTTMDEQLVERLWYSKDITPPRTLPVGNGWMRYYKQYKAAIWQVDFQVLTAANGRRTTVNANDPMPIAYLN